MARCAIHSAATSFLSGICALRNMEWRGAQLNQEAPKRVSGSCASRNMVWRGAPVENSSWIGIT
ncbi:hypothetical protein A2U01_0061035, partial [Trifolium medium]|nr:hypothetical protein [Trifolium medium]